MTWAGIELRANALRSAVNAPRGIVVAIVGGLSALGGAIAGAAAALVGAAVLTPTEPWTGTQLVLMAVEYGFVAGLAGSVLGTAAGFGALRRVPLGRLILWTNMGLAAGITAGWLGGPWAWHHMGFLGFVGFSSGALLARALSQGAPLPISSPTSDSVAASGTIALETHGVIRLPGAPVRVEPSTHQIVDRALRRSPPGE